MLSEEIVSETVEARMSHVDTTIWQWQRSVLQFASVSPEEVGGVFRLNCVDSV